ncbi:MAG: hypothetical protein ABI467_30255 [Kofleriaceae bacterium]
MISWRTAAIVLALVCGVQRWQSCTRSAATRIVARDVARDAAIPPSLALARVLVPASSTPPTRVRTWFGFRPPAWAAHLLPQPGENMRAYRDRILPIAQVVIAPQRARVARLRDRLDDHQRAALDQAAGEAAAAIEARVTKAVVDGELQTVTPMTGVTMARELLDIVERGNTRFASALTADQRDQLASSRFDFADYLLFATPWEDALNR